MFAFYQQMVPGTEHASNTEMSIYKFDTSNYSVIYAEDMQTVLKWSHWWTDKKGPAVLQK